MANVTHSTRTDPDLHEPKGASTAAAGRIAQADGAGATVWARPMDLIASINNESGTSETWTGLSAYRELIISVENMINTNNTYFLLQLYTGSTWRTSGYLNSVIREGNDWDDSNINAEGLAFGRTRDNSRLYYNGITRITNFNDASRKTSHHATGVTTKTNYITSSTTPSDLFEGAYTGLYDTAEAHEGIRFRVKGSNSFSELYATIWGIKS